MNDQEVMTVSEVMQELNLSRAMIIRYIRQGFLQGYQRAPIKKSEWRVYRSSVEEFKRRRGEVSRASREVGGAER